MEHIEAIDKEHARATRTEIINAAAILLSTEGDPIEQTDIDSALDRAVLLYRGASARIKFKPAQPKPEVSAAA